uniref:Alpha-tocopherol transfer protein-like n=1 Tax=Schistocephalus solidus TaxID=70667 RepID=A0A0X3Q093_SCHSO
MSVIDFAIKELKPATIEKAQIELNEIHESFPSSIQQFRQIILDNEGLNGCLEDAFLLRFLRARKYDMQKALALYLNHYAIRQQYPDVFENLKPSLVRHVFVTGIVSMLPEATSEGHRILLFRPALWQPDEWPSSDLLRANVIVVEDLLQNYHEAQVHGLVVLVSLSGFGWKHACQLSNLDFARRAARLLQDTTPVRVKAVHMVNEPAMFSRVFGLVQPLLKPKQQRRVSHSRRLHLFCPTFLFFTLAVLQILPRRGQGMHYAPILYISWWFSSNTLRSLISPLN